jgi:sphingolipid delta-4 desaturase
MTASTSTVTTARENGKGVGARLRVGEAEAEREQVLDVKEHDFFWTYTEEPHRTRRMAIIKAHPEVRHIICSLLYRNSKLIAPSR